MRTRLPDRRPQVTERVVWSLEEGKWETKVYVSAGFDPDTWRLREVFLRGAGKSGSERDFLLDDVAVLLARDLQCGDSVEQLAAGMGRKPDGSPTSILGAVLDALVKIEAEVKGETAPAPPLPGNIVKLRPDDGSNG